MKGRQGEESVRCLVLGTDFQIHSELVQWKGADEIVVGLLQDFSRDQFDPTDRASEIFNVLSLRSSHVVMF